MKRVYLCDNLDVIPNFVNIWIQDIKMAIILK
jgi:hypothetical protein